jgi:superoxide dismutase, Fe-Mn family
MKILMKVIAAIIFGLIVIPFNLHAQQLKPQNFYVTDSDGNQTGFALPALPYAYDALEPSIDKLTVEIHYDRHHRNYFNKFVAAVKGTQYEKMKFEAIFASAGKAGDAIRNNGGGLYNHTLYWENMKQGGGGLPSGMLAAAIDKQFGSFDKFKELFGTTAKNKFGSGWAWLIITRNGELKVTSTSNQDNPLMDCATEQGAPLLALDLWEHAYYLKYQNKRGDYVDAFWNIINWPEVERRFAVAKKP